MSKKEYDFLAFLALIVWFSLYLNTLPWPNAQITYWDVYWGITEGIFFNIYCALSGPRQFKRFVTEQEAIVSSELLPIRCILRRIIMKKPYFYSFAILKKIYKTGKVILNKIYKTGKMIVK